MAKRELTVTNELTGETFRTKSLARAQAYRDRNEDGVVAITRGSLRSRRGYVLIGESSGRYLLRKAAAGRTVTLKGAGLTPGACVHLQNLLYY